MTSSSLSPPEVRRCRPLLGTFVEVVGESAAVVEAGYGAVARTHALMSFQDPASELSRINRTPPGRWTTCDLWTAEVLARACFWTETSRGAFDPSAGEPADEGPWAGVELRNGAVRRLSRTRIDLSGIAKGYAVDRAVAAMRAAGARCGLVNAGGDLRGFGRQAWPVAIVEPRGRRPAIEIEVRDRALATSASVAASAWAAASVLAPSAMDADALAKTALYAPPALALESLALVGAEALALGPAGWAQLEAAA